MLPLGDPVGHEKPGSREQVSAICHLWHFLQLWHFFQLWHFNDFGNFQAAGNSAVPPADLTRISVRNGGTFPLARVARVISGEEPLPGGHGTREMPVRGPVFSRVNADQDPSRIRLDNRASYLSQIQRH